MADITVEISTGTITVDASQEVVTLDTGAQGIPGTGDLFNLAVSATGALLSGEILLRHVFASAISFADDFSGSYATADTASTGTVACSITKNGSQVATITFTASATGVFATAGGAVSFAAGDVLRIIAPASADATLADLSITLYGTR